MASTAHKTADEVKEHHDPPEVFAAKIDQLAKLVRESRRMCVWTGAGVSTSCGIPDFRGPNGKWTLQAQHRERDSSIKVVNSINAAPSPTHMALVGLMQAGLLPEFISTNTDGLHCRSGIPSTNISELHGNTNKTRCNKCHRFAYADTRTRVATKTKSHETKQPCPYAGCSGEMCDTIINFGEYLLHEVSTSANRAGDRADLLLGLGSSFRVITCDALEQIQANGGKLVIANLQTTPYDNACALRIFATCDDVMTALMAKLSIPIPSWHLTRSVRLQVSPSAATGGMTVSALGLSDVQEPYGWIKSFQLGSMDEAGVKFVPLANATGALNPKSLYAPLCCTVAKEKSVPALPTHIRLNTFGHRGEPPVVVPLPPVASPPCDCALDLDHENGRWSVSVPAATTSSLPPTVSKRVSLNP